LRYLYVNSADIYHFILGVHTADYDLYLLIEHIMQKRDYNRLLVLTKKEANKNATRQELQELEALEYKVIDQRHGSELDDTYDAKLFLK
jgi:hypothetical protein